MHLQTVISTAANQYANRPKDERYGSVQALVDVARADREHSAEKVYNLKDLQFVAAGSDGLQLRSPKGQASLTHWAFGQMARILGAPAGYLRTGLPADVAAQCLNVGIARSFVGSTAVLLVQAANGKPEPTIRSVTSETYGRVWDHDLYGAIAQTITSKDPSWTLPPTWDGEPAGAYRGDRDSFVVLTHGGSIVNDPSVRGGKDGRMYRGLMIHNSEVGACSVTIEQVLYQYVCGNHNFWGAVIDARFRRRHVGQKTLRDVISEVHQIAYTWANRSAAADEAIIQSLIDHELAATKEGIIDELKKIGASKEQAEAAYAQCEQKFDASPRSFWGINQGLTSLSQETAYQSDRLELDLLAAKVLARGAKVYA